MEKKASKTVEPEGISTEETKAAPVEQSPEETKVEETKAAPVEQSPEETKVEETKAAPVKETPRRKVIVVVNRFTDKTDLETIFEVGQELEFDDERAADVVSRGLAIFKEQ